MLAAVSATAKPEPLVPVYMPSPRYPMAALRAQREGQVILNVTVTQGGDVTDVSVGHSSGDLDLDHAAEDAVRGWRFAAAGFFAAFAAANELPALALLPLILCL